MHTFWKDYLPWTLGLLEAGKLTILEAENFHWTIISTEQELFLCKHWRGQWKDSSSQLSRMEWGGFGKSSLGLGDSQKKISPPQQGASLPSFPGEPLIIAWSLLIFCWLSCSSFTLPFQPGGLPIILFFPAHKKKNPTILKLSSLPLQSENLKVVRKCQGLEPGCFCCHIGLCFTRNLSIGRLQKPGISGVSREFESLEMFEEYPRLDVRKDKSFYLYFDSCEKTYTVSSSVSSDYLL